MLEGEVVAEVVERETFSGGKGTPPEFFLPSNPLSRLVRETFLGEVFCEGESFPSSRRKLGAWLVSLLPLFTLTDTWRLNLGQRSNPPLLPNSPM